METLAHTIADEIVSAYPVDSVTVRVRKPELHRRPMDMWSARSLAKERHEPYLRSPSRSFMSCTLSNWTPPTPGCARWLQGECLRAL